MKTFIIVFGLFPLFTFGQKAKHDETNPGGLAEKRFKLTVGNIAPASLKLPFSSIKIVDARYDTSKLGFAPVYRLFPNYKRVGKKLCFKGGIAKGLENYYNEFYQPAYAANDLKLIIVLKKFWLSGIDNKKNRGIDITENSHAARFLYCKLEYYFNRADTFMPLKRTDTVINEVMFDANDDEPFDNDPNEHMKLSYKRLKLILNSFIERLDFNNMVSKMKELPKKTWQQVQAYNDSFFDMPVLKDSSIAKGVYIDFDEFKNNKPSIINFKEKKMRFGINKTEDYIEDDKGNRITSYWGYFNGEVLKISRYGNDELYRINNTFEFFARHKYITENTNIVGGTSYTENEVWVPYQIDMETGNIY